MLASRSDSEKCSKIVGNIRRTRRTFFTSSKNSALTGSDFAFQSMLLKYMTPVPFLTFLGLFHSSPIHQMGRKGDRAI